MSATTVPVRMELGRRFPVSPSEGFDYIADLANWPEYWPRLVRIDPGSRWREPGDRTRLSLRMLGRTIELEMTLERFEPHRLVEYRSRQRGLPPVAHERHFTEVDGGFEFRIVIEYAPRRRLRGILDRVLVRRAAKRAMRETMDNLERRFAARTASSEPSAPGHAPDDLDGVVLLHSRDAPDARLEVIAHASHHPSLEQPDAFNRLLLEFLAQTANPHARRSG
jgi:pimeloyl-ACP methyl ester carboxylesterase